MEKNQDIQEGQQAEKQKDSFWYALFHKPRVLEKETCLFILVSALDFFMTFILLYMNEKRLHQGYTLHGGYYLGESLYIESNPVARFFLNHWGIKGLLYFKFVMVAFVVLIAQYIAQTHYKAAKFLLILGTTIVAIVVVYSFYLYLKGYEIMAEFHDLVALLF